MTRNRPITQVEVEEAILDRIDGLEALNEKYEELLETEARQGAYYKGAAARLYLQAEGPQKQREAWVDFKLREEYEELEITRAMVKAKAAKMTSVRTELDSLRSLAANVRNSTS